jgi:hypothetical protein
LWRGRLWVMTDELVPASERWLTYIEVGERLGVSVEAVRAMAQRGGWPEQRANGIGQVVRVQVPKNLFTTSGRPLATTGGATVGLPLVIRTEIEAAVEVMVGPLREELARATERAERAERQVVVLRAKLIAARLAGERARTEMVDLRDYATAVLKGRVRRGWWPWGRPWKSPLEPR